MREVAALVRQERHAGSAGPDMPSGPVRGDRTWRRPGGAVSTISTTGPGPAAQGLPLVTVMVTVALAFAVTSSPR
jgi:hypothetical protein